MLSFVAASTLCHTPVLLSAMRQDEVYFDYSRTSPPWWNDSHLDGVKMRQKERKRGIAARESLLSSWDSLGNEPNRLSIWSEPCLIWMLEQPSARLTNERCR